MNSQSQFGKPKKMMDEFFAAPLFFLYLTTLISLLYFLYKPRRPHTHRNLPPSPPTLPILGNLHQLTALTHRSFHSLATNHGPLMLLRFGTRPVLIVQSAAAAAEIMKTNDLLFADKPHSKTTRRLFYNLKDISVAPYGEYWRKLKTISILRLLNAKKVQSFHFIREEETKLLVDTIESRCSDHSPVDLTDLFATFTNDIICRSAFGRKYSQGKDGKMFLKLLGEFMQLLGSVNVGEFIPWLWWINQLNGFDRRVEKVATEIDKFLEMVIQEHLNAVGGDHVEENFVDILLDSSIDRDGIKAIILDILAGGTDTTSATLEWAMTELLRHPSVLKTLKAELRAIINDDNDRGITNQDLDKMKYLKAVVKETLRIHPPFPFLGRVAREDVKVMGYDVVAGTMVITNTWAIGRDPASWDEPTKFKPERFFNCSIDFKGLDFELIPFGAGRRGCPGIGFATANIELVLANLVHAFEWGLPGGMKLEDLDTVEQPGVTCRRKNALLAIASKSQF